ncbi:hypothetical protein M513_09245 [Trichuris suis]|uniref:Uncharacterized protein n=1 Tax=Trichuris suis TaxID=68888 RepID=A0A085LY70_9BILA|nr:hypothetical protein M513_09245 [Trichuris suis]
MYCWEIVSIATSTGPGSVGLLALTDAELTMEKSVSGPSQTSALQGPSTAPLENHWFRYELNQFSKLRRVIFGSDQNFRHSRLKTYSLSFKLRAPMVRKGLDVAGPQVVTINTSHWHMRRTKENISAINEYCYPLTTKGDREVASGTGASESQLPLIYRLYQGRRNAASAAQQPDANSVIIKSEAKMDREAMLPFGNDLQSANNGFLRGQSQCERRFNTLTKNAKKPWKDQNEDPPTTRYEANSL